MNIRSMLNYDEGYYKINREERNFAAILYHVLLTCDNLRLFLKAINSKLPIVEREIGIYFEYAYIRDLWNSIRHGNDFKRKLILDLLQPVNREKLEKMSVQDFNLYFGAVRTPSTDFIASPGNWSMRHYDANIQDHDEFLKVCKFKWCFNAKPDMVIHTTNITAVCIEAKYESVEGLYPGNEMEKRIFQGRGLKLVGQLSIQKKIMEELLGIRTEFRYLVQKVPTDNNGEIINWKEAFSGLDISTCPYFIKEWIKRFDK